MPQLAAEQAKKIPNVRECVVAYTRWGPLRGRPPRAVLFFCRGLDHAGRPTHHRHRHHHARGRPATIGSQVIGGRDGERARRPSRWLVALWATECPRDRASSLCRPSWGYLSAGRLLVSGSSPAIPATSPGYEKTPTGSLRPGSFWWFGIG